jgi:hypothetical protein
LINAFGNKVKRSKMKDRFTISLCYRVQGGGGIAEVATDKFRIRGNSSGVTPLEIIESYYLIPVFKQFGDRNTANVPSSTCNQHSHRSPFG